MYSIITYIYDKHINIRFLYNFGGSGLLWGDTPHYYLQYFLPPHFKKLLTPLICTINWNQKLEKLTLCMYWWESSRKKTPNPTLHHPKRSLGTTQCLKNEGEIFFNICTVVPYFRTIIFSFKVLMRFQSFVLHSNLKIYRISLNKVRGH